VPREARNWPEAATPKCNTNSEWAGVLDSAAGQIVVLRDLASQLHGGDRVTFTWVKD